ncbi:MAG: MFS transporter [Thaumarchaeota archaeon]|nr:MFS transporter [Nitrososphaerota archaeon]
MTNAPIHSRGLVLFGLIMGLFLSAIEMTVVSTAMPKAAVELGGTDLYSWIFGAYILLVTITGPLWGRLSDMYGRRAIYLIGVAVFLAGSMLSGAAQDMFQLVIFRVVQGVGGGALLVLTFTIVGEIYQLRERSRVQGYLSSVWAIASIVGPPAGGFIAENISWRWVFYINIPFGIMALVMVAKWLTNQKRGPSGGLDLPGTFFFTLSTSFLMIFLTEYSDLSGLTEFTFLIVSAVAMIVFFKIEASAKSPLIPLGLLLDRVLSIALVGNLLFGVAFFGMLSYVPILLQWLLGLPASDSGLLLTPSVLGWTVAAVIASRLLTKISLKPIVLTSVVLMSTGLVIIAFFHGTFAVAAGGLLVGAGMGSVVTPLLIVVQTMVNPGSLGVATALLSFMRTLGGTIGVMLMWVPIKASLDAAGLKTVTILTPQQISILSSGFQYAFLIGLAAALVCFPIYLMLPRLNLSEWDQARSASTPD